MENIDYNNIYIYSLIPKADKEYFKENLRYIKCPKGEVLSGGSDDCLGFISVISGQIRAYSTSSNGRELTLFRLLEGDECFLSASCIMSVNLDVQFVAQKESVIAVLPSCCLKTIMDESAKVSSYANQMLATNLQEVLWIMDQTLFKSFDTRLANFLIEESALEEDDCLRITHDEIANHLGTAREVVSRMLKAFQNEKIVHLNRGVINIKNKAKLIELSKF